jgi:hypothetical protein
LAFITSTTRDADSSLIDDYNTFVTMVANSQVGLLSLGTTWTAIASTANKDARDNTGTNPTVSAGVKIYLVDGTTKIADNNADLWDGTLDNAIKFDETGSLTNIAYVWTGTSSSGIATSDPLGSSKKTFGFTNSTSSIWMDYGSTTDFFAELPLYALSGILTVAAVPEPGMLILFSAGLAFCAVARRRNQNTRRS